MQLPRRVKIKEVVQGRYPTDRPISWDHRKSGVELVRSAEGETLKLFSNGGQSTPQSGWELLLMREVMVGGDSALEWTLYGLQPGTI